MGNLAYIILMILFAAVMAGGYALVRSSKKGLALDQGRRSFLGFGGEENGHAIFIGMQIAIQVFGSDELRSRLADLIASPSDPDRERNDDAASKRLFLKSLAAIMLDNQYAWEYGFWDFRRNGDEAIAQFSEWTNELEGSMATSPEELGTEVDSLHRFSDQKEFLIVTLLLLIDNRDEPVSDDVGDYEFRPTYFQLAKPFLNLLEQISDEDFWKSETFSGLLNGITTLDPRVIERDGVFIYPGAAQDGISSLDLLSDKEWKYLTDHSLRLS
jgi:hypothetical protein